MDKTIVLKLPDAKAKGFFQFLRGFSVFSEVMSKPLGRTPQEIDTAVDWLVSVVDQPKDKKEARKLVLSMSAEDVGELIRSASKVVAVEPDPLSSAE